MIPIKKLRKRSYNKFIDAQKHLSYSRLIYEQCTNTNEDEREILKCMADVWCLLLEQAERVYALGDYRYHSTVGMVCVKRRVPNHTGQTKRTATVQMF